VFVINVLLVGGADSFFLGAIVDRLLKEKIRIFHIAGRNAPKSAYKDSQVVTYSIDVDDEYVQFVVRSIMPDCIVYLGAFDDRHIWRDYHRCSARYMCELTNILVTASDLSIKKFIYLSSLDVYGFKNSGVINEDRPIEPANVKAIIIAQGERLCKDFTDQKKINATTLRFGLVYGDPHFKNIHTDYVMKKCLDAIIERKITINNRIFPLIYVTDAALAVWKVVSLETNGGIYNICDDETVSDAEISDIILTEFLEYDIALEGDETFEPQDYAIDGTKFRAEFSFFQKTKYQEGIQTVARYVRDNQYRLNKQSHKKPETNEEKKNFWFYAKFFWKKIIPYIETLVVFFLFVGLDSLMKDTFYIKNVDVMVGFMVIISIAFGKQAALTGVLLSIIFWMVPEIKQTDLLSVVISSGFIIRILFLFIIGIVIGHTRDRLHQNMNELSARNEYVENEYRKLDEINDITVMVKTELEERLLTYSDSLATNYAIIEEIDTLLPSKIYLRAVNVITNILKSKSICVYVRDISTGEYNLVSWTDETSKTLGSSINLRYLGSMNESFIKNEIFANKDLAENLPLLASPIHVDGQIEAVVMVWTLKFDSLTMYHINLFVTLSKIIRHSISKATLYRKSLMAQMHEQSEDIARKLLSDTEFADAVEVAHESEKEFKIPYCIITVNTGSLDEVTAVNILEPVLKGISYYNRHEGRFEILLNGTSPEEMQSFLSQPENQTNPKMNAIQVVFTE